jgi:t-SNARE complex subunit (syntaxin)
LCAHAPVVVVAVCREKASSAKKYLEEKQRDLEVIEKNMMELNELMKDFAVMVESANEPLDQIDTYLRGTKVPVIAMLTFHHPNCNPTG